MEKPDCPRCRTNVNMVRLTNSYRCAYCGTEIPLTDKFGNPEVQQKLF